MREESHLGESKRLVVISKTNSPNANTSAPRKSVFARVYDFKLH